MKITGNTILITGGTSGIGRALGEALHTRGNVVIVAGRRRKLLDEIQESNPGMVGLEVDVNEESSVEQLAIQMRQQFPQLNVLINNAGIMRTEDFASESGDVSLSAEIVNTNINSIVRVTSALLPLLKAQPRSTLMATTSGLAFVPLPLTPTYNGTKAFLHSWLDALRYQLKDSSVEVLELAPPYVQTELLGPTQKSDPRAMPLNDFIHEVLQILESENTPKGEILVDRVKPLRWAEKDDQYDSVMEMLAGL